jgi:hypothetical protein
MGMRRCASRRESSWDKGEEKRGPFRKERAAFFLQTKTIAKTPSDGGAVLRRLISFQC